MRIANTAESATETLSAKESKFTPEELMAAVSPLRYANSIPQPDWSAEDLIQAYQTLHPNI